MMTTPERVDQHQRCAVVEAVESRMSGGLGNRCHVPTVIVAAFPKPAAVIIAVVSDGSGLPAVASHGSGIPEVAGHGSGLPTEAGDESGIPEVAGHGSSLPDATVVAVVDAAASAALADGAAVAKDKRKRERAMGGGGAVVDAAASAALAEHAAVAEDSRERENGRTSTAHAASERSIELKPTILPPRRRKEVGKDGGGEPSGRRRRRHESEQGDAEEPQEVADECAVMVVADTTHGRKRATQHERASGVEEGQPNSRIIILDAAVVAVVDGNYRRLAALLVLTRQVVGHRSHLVVPALYYFRSQLSYIVV
uniref:Uncharacterized protein n=1 Tax=Oryza sativa subsp. japonica TaxID=39947 RepID=Q651I0_ORYSJ|nr:hypothetical protein [Oryza sativa Japonica Group]